MDTNPARLEPNRVVDEACAGTFLADQAREQDTNLVFVRDHIVRSATDLGAILDLYRRVLQRRVVAGSGHDPGLDHLRLSGLVRQEGRSFFVRNRIYQRVFDRAWIKEHMPEAEARRQRRAFWAGATLAATVALALALLVAAIVRERMGRLQAIQARAEAEAELAAFFELSTDPFAIANSEGYFTRLNGHWTNLLGYPLGELMARPYTNFVHPDDRFSTAVEAENLNRGSKVLDFTNRYVHSNGTKVVTLVWRANIDAERTVRATARPILTNAVAVPLR